MATHFILNEKPAVADAPPQTPLLWVLREGFNLTGTKFGCGTGLCGACMVHIDGKRAYSCQTRDLGGRGQTGHHDRRPVGAFVASRCRRPGSPNGCRNAATASPARS